MPVHNSYTLDYAASEKNANCRESLKALADIYVTYPSPNDYVKVYRQAMLLGHIDPALNLTVVCIPNGVLIFRDKTEDEVLALIESASPKKRLPLTDKVLIKMAAHRMGLVIREARRKNELAESYKKVDDKKYSQSIMDQFSRTITIPEFRTVKSFASFWETHNLVSPYMKEGRELKEFLLRPELRDEHISKAQDLLLMQEVHES